MKIESLIALCVDKNISISLAGDNLKIKAAPGVITPDIKIALVENKPELIDWLRANQAQDATQTFREFGKTRAAKHLVASSNQKRLWMVDRIEGHSAQYNMPIVLSLNGEINEQALRRALNDILQRHQVLRTCYRASDQFTDQADEQGIELHLLPNEELPCSKIDLTAASAAILDQADTAGFDQAAAPDFNKVLLQEIEKPFDLSSDLMVRATLVTLGHEAYRLIIVAHHIAVDEWSAALLLKELASLYNHHSENTQSETACPLSAVEKDYSDYAQWQAEVLTEDVVDERVAFWSNKLNDRPRLHSLPLDRLRPKRQSFEGENHQQRVDSESYAKIQKLIAEQEVSFFAFIYGAFSVLLSRYSNGESVNIGVPVVNRSEPELMEMIGYFANTIVLSAELGDNPTFSALMQRGSTEISEGLAHQDAPFERVVDALVNDRDLSYSPLFQIMLTLEDNDFVAPAFNGLEATLDHTEISNAKFDLTLQVKEETDGVNINWNYATDIFDRQTVEQMAGHFSRLIETLVQAPETPVFEAAFLQEQEINQQVVEWNRPQSGNQAGYHADYQTDYQTDSAIHELFEAQAAASPDAIALVFDGQSLSYETLNQRANQLARYLVEKKSVVPDCIVGICIERSFEMVIAILAVLKAGGAYLSLDPDYPEARLSYMLEDSGVDIVLTSENLVDVLPVGERHHVCLDTESLVEKLSECSSHNIAKSDIGLSAGHLAYVIYTSGSTGQPKGVMLEHRGLCNLSAVQRDQFSVNASSRVLQFASLAFDAATWEWCMALTNGASLILASQETIRDANMLASLVENQRVTHATLPPSVLELFDASGWESVTTLVVAGEACSKKLANLWSTVGSQPRQFVNAYGPTETTICASMAEYAPGQDAVCMGGPIHNFQVYILDAQQRLLPAGVVGELYIGGVGLARGYLNKSALTESSFVPNPFYDTDNPASSERLYKTGDLVRWRKDASEGAVLEGAVLEYIGRDDYQVKVRGFRIELGEIEARLRDIADVKEAVVLAKKAHEEHQLTAYIVANNADTNDTATADSLKQDIQAQLKAHLPSHMVPSYWVMLDALPLTANGKIDRKALPDPDTVALNQQPEYVAPTTETEILLCDIWQEVLQIERIGIEDNFFELGGHSLLAIRVANRMQANGIHIPVSTLFQASNIAELGQLIDAKVANQEATIYRAPKNKIAPDCTRITPDLLPLIDLTQTEIDQIARHLGSMNAIQDIYPLGPLQEGIYFHHMMSLDADPYVMPSLLRLANAESVDTLVNALQFMVDRHDSLRTIVLSEGLNQPVQVVLRQATLPVVWLDTATDAEQDIQAHMQSLCAPEKQWLDTDQAPLLRVQIAKEPNTNTYYALLQHHHLVTDHEGLELIRRELVACFTDQQSSLPAAIPYREFIASALHHQTHQGAQDFFSEMLGDIDSPTLPFGLANTQGDGADIAEKRRMLLKPLSEKIRTQARRLRTNPATLFHAAWGLVVAITSGQAQAVFGTVLSGRTGSSQNVESMLGVLINTLPMRVDIDERTVESYVKDTHQRLSHLLSYEQIALSQAQRHSQVSSDIPLFSALLNYRHSQTQALPEDQLAGIEFIHAQERTNYPLTLNVDDYGVGDGIGDVAGGFELDAQVHRSINIDRLLDYMEQSLAQVVEHLELEPKTPIHNLRILPPSETQQQLIDWNATEKTFSDHGIEQIFSAISAQSGDAVAASFVNAQGQVNSISYAELEQQSNQLAHQLISNDIGVGSLVGICQYRSLDMLVSVLAVLKSGAAYVPLDPTYPAERIRTMLQDADLSLVLTDQAVVNNDLLPTDSMLERIIVDSSDHQGRLSDFPAGLPTTNATSDDLAYVIYTSGSTGRPKGVEVTRGNLSNFIHAMQDLFDLDKDDKLLALTSLSFDIAGLELYLPLVTGAQVMLGDESLSLDGERIATTLREQEVSLMQATPVSWKLLLESGWQHSNSNQRPFKALCGGEAFPTELAKELLEQPIRVWNMYGPTETTIWSSACELTPELLTNTTPIGRPIANTQLYIVDEQHQLVPQGAVGELLIGGLGVAKGYRHRADLTVERFIDNPFKDKANSSHRQKLYKTGDLARYRSDGKVECLGRIDTQVKVRGFRVELGEIETALKAHNDVRDAVVHVIEYLGESQLVGYILKLEDQQDYQVDTGELSRHLSESLPAYMIPSLWVEIDEIPLTPNGKVDRKALPHPGGNAQQRDYVAPTNETEKVLCELWQEVLQQERVGIHDNFFELGGHSLLVTRMVAMLNQQLGIRLPLREVFQLQQISKLAAAIDTGDYADSASKLVPVSRDQALPLSFQQQRLWLLDQIDEGSSHYLIQGALKLNGQLNRKALDWAFNEIIQRHESLRTRFVADGDNDPIQVIQPASDFALADHDISDSKDRFEQLLIEEGSRGFDLAHDLMLRANLIKLSEDQHVLQVVMHHIASDGWSLPILVSELMQLYQARCQQQPHPLPDLPIQYADYAYWQRSQEAVLSEQLDYWKTQLANIPVVHNLPLDKPRPQTQSFAGKLHCSEISIESSDLLRTLCTENNATLFVGLHAVFALLLSRYSGAFGREKDIVVGSPIANREQAEVTDLIGFFVNLLVLRTEVDTTQSFHDLLNQSKATLLDAYAHQQVPFEQLVDELQPQRSLSHSPLFQVMLALETGDAHQVLQSANGLDIYPLPLTHTIAKYDLTLTVADQGDQTALKLIWEFNADLFNESTIRRFSNTFEQLIRVTTERPAEPLQSLDLITEQERNNQLIDWNGSVSNDVTNISLQQLFEEQVARSPNALALVCGDETLSYRELNTRANQFAHYLIEEKQVVPDTLIGVCMDRSIDMIIAVFGILKAGAAYVPLDPDYPAQRLNYMLADSDAKLVLTQRHLLGEAAISIHQALCMDDEELLRDLSSYSGKNVASSDIGLTPNHLAYVIYTSGSVGQPKGVMVEHRSLSNLIQWYRQEYEMTDRDRMLLVSSMSFDLTQKNLFAPLCAGASLILPTQPHYDPVASAESIAEHQISLVNCAPSMFYPVVESASDQAYESLKSLRLVLFGGEPINEKRLVYWLDHQNCHANIVNMYGPTECTDIVTSSDQGRAIQSHLIGSAIRNQSVYVLDANQQLLPTGVIGELCVGGAGVARGYLNQPELTEASFIPNPFFNTDNPASSERLYRTGDLVRWRDNPDADGVMEYIGRIDHQVKVRGVRIELGEIESQVRRSEVVNDVVVAAKTIQDEQQLVAYVVSENAETAEELDAVKRDLKAQLPNYMVPSYWVRLDALPLTPNGKVDRKALPDPDASAQQRKYVAPETETEQLLCDIWQHVLNLERVGTQDNFFELGGHSLLAIHVISGLKHQGINVPVRYLFQANNLRELAQLIDQGDQQNHFVAPPNLITSDTEMITPELLPLIDLTQEEIDQIAEQVGGVKHIQDIYPLGPLQEGIYFHHLISRDSDPYVMPSLLKVESSQNLVTLLDALQTIIDRHDALRTQVLSEGLSRPVQVVLRQAKLPVQWLDVKDEQDVEAHMHSLCAPEKQWIDIDQAPLMRVSIAKQLRSGTHYLLLQHHHLVTDHEGLEIIRQELMAYYASRQDARPRSLPPVIPPSIPYREFVAHALHQQKSNDARTFFSEMLGEITEPTLPFGLVNVQEDGIGIVEKRQPISTELADNIRAQAKRLKTNPATLFHAAWGLVVSATSGQPSAVFGTVLSGRLQGTEGAERMMGVLINTLPIRVDIDDSSSKDYIQTIHTSLSQLLSYEQTPLSQAQRYSGVSSDLPLFSALLNYRHSVSQPESQQVEHDQLAGIEFIHGQERTNYPFTLNVDDYGGGLGEGGFVLDAQVHKSIDIDRLLAYMTQALEQLVSALNAGEEKSVDTLRILPADEVQQQLVEWNNTNVDYPLDKGWLGVFNDQVLKTPDARAAGCKDKTLTYAELDQFSNRLARALTELLAFTSSANSYPIVAVYDDRGIDWLVTVIAIWKAGATYLPLDPSYPDSRTQQVLRQAQPDIVLSATRIESLHAVLENIGGLEGLTLCSTAELLDTEQDDSALPLVIQPDDIAYIIFTSGSTGEPKGVQVTHEGMLNHFFGKINQLSLTEKDVLAQTATQSFDISIWQLLTALMVGGRVEIYPYEISRDPQVLSERIAQDGVTVMQLVPSFIRTWLEVEKETRELSLRWLVSSGEALTPPVLKSWFERYPNIQVMNAYGPSECSDIISYWPMNSLTQADNNRVAIGRPAPNMQLYVLDSQQRLLPEGAAGELCVSGMGVGPGYLNQPDLTQEAFVANPFYGPDNPVSSEHLYKTGDLVRWRVSNEGDNKDGVVLEYIGRIDHQVKVRGFRIELGEIESRLRVSDQVKDAVVIAKTIQDEQQLVAYLVLENPETTEELDDLKQDLKAQLPNYMVPSYWVTLDALPLTPNGKIDRKALPDPDASIQQREYIAPTTETEKALCEIWQDVLNLERVGTQDNFFELGGHSLLLVRVISAMQSKGLVCDISDFFKAKDLAECARLVDQADHKLYRAPANLIPADCARVTPDLLPLIDLSQNEIDLIATHVGGASNIQDIYPLGPLQEGIYYHHVMSQDQDQNNDPYVIPSLTSVANESVLERLLEALQFIVDRHDVLRTAVISDGLHQPVQVVLRKATLPVKYIALSENENAETAMSESAAPDRQWMAVDKAPLIDVQVAKQAGLSEYFVLVRYHHLISDHEGLDILRYELSTFYSGIADTLPPSIPYREFVAHTLHQKQQTDAESFFTKMLADIDEPTLPFCLADTRGSGQKIIEVTRPIDNELGLRIRALAQSLSINPATMFHAAWGLVVAATSSQQAAVFGTVLSGRLHGALDAKNMMGVFINTLPFRVDIDHRDSHSYVADVHQALTQLLRYEQAPLVLAQNFSQLPKDQPLFSALLNYRHSVLNQPTDAEWNQDGGIRFIDGGVRNNYPITLSVDDFGKDGFALVGLFEQSLDADRLMAYMQTALSNLADELEAKSSKAITHISILPASEQDRLVNDHTEPLENEIASSSVHSLFESQVEAHPDAIAVLYESESLTYGELNARANRLARYLREQGIERETRVGLYLDRSVHLIEAILGVLKAGGAYVPIDVSWPKGRVEQILADADVSLVLTEQQWQADIDALELSDIQSHILNAEQTAWGNYSDTNPESINSPTGAAYVIYTSGSMGVPKGVLVEHQQIINYAHAITQRLALENDQPRFGHISTIAADLGNTSLYGALCFGGSLHLVSTERAFDPDAVAAQFAEYPVDVLKIVPGHLQGLLAAENAKYLLPKQCLILGGEACSVDLIKRVRALAPDVRIINHYGPSETTVGVLTHEINKEDIQPQSIPIGTPLANCRAYILDQAQQLAPEGIAGELYIGGANVARGYLNNSEQTAERFIPNPFGFSPTSSPTSSPTEIGSDRLYRTGDKVRRDQYGDIIFLGRMDNQVKVRGYRVELGDIESTLNQQPEIAESVVRLNKTDQSDQLIAYVVLSQPEGEEIEQQLTAELKAALPEYMLPQRIQILDAIPRTPNGKVDVRQLDQLAADQESSSSLSSARAPRNDIERTLVDIWQQVLGHGSIGIDDNFFALGGDSILGLQVIARAKRAGIKFSPKQFFDAQTIADLADNIGGDSIGAEETKHTEPALVHVPNGEAIPLSFSQQRLWFLHQLEGANSSYNIVSGVALSGDLNVSLVKKCFDTLIARHTSLRSYFPTIDSEPQQCDHLHEGTYSDFTVEHLDFSRQDTAVAKQQARDYASAFSRHKFDIEQDWLIKVGLLTISEREAWLLVNMHHIITDGWSINILINEFKILYSQQSLASESDQVSLPKLDYQYPDYAWWQQHIAGDYYQQQIDYWVKRLADAPARLTLPTDKSRPLRQSYAGDYLNVHLDREVTAQINQVARDNDCTPYVVLLSCWFILLARYSGQSDICVGTPIANRHSTETQAMVGFFANSLVMRGDLSGDMSVKEFLAQVKQTNIEAQNHQSAPFEKVVDALDVPRDQSYSPLFQVMFALGIGHKNLSASSISDEFSQALKVSSIEDAESVLNTFSSKFDMDLNLREIDGEILGELTYCVDLFERETIARIWEHYQNIVRAVIADTTNRLPQLPLTLESELAALAHWNATEKTFSDCSVEQIFSAVSAERAEAIVASFVDGEGHIEVISYAELERQSNQLAHHLISNDIGVGSLVGICQHRSLDMLVSLLAVLKSGAAYVPLDPTYPAERIRYMLQDAGLSLVLTDQAVQETDLLPTDSALERIIVDSSDHQGRLSDFPAGLPTTNATSDDLAYVIYTSGSTGRPKGVEVTRGNLSNFVHAMQDLLDLGTDDKLLALTSLSFDIAGLELYLPLVTGAQVMLGDESLSLDGERIATILREQEVSLMQATPVSWKLLLESGWQCSNSNQRPFKALCGGEAFPTELAKALLEQPIRVWNMYGPTETTIWSSVCELTPELLTNTTPIGRPIANTQLYIVDDQRQLVPQGAVGELLIGGLGVAKGYLNRPDLTVDRFINNPFYDAKKPAQSTRLYKTGDLARYRSDGTVECLGRIDTQVKVRGFRVELGEIEAALKAHSDVRDAVVNVIEYLGESQLVGYILKLEDQQDYQVDTGELSRHLSESLPAYMIPSLWVEIDEVPLTPNGKVDRKALPKPDSVVSQRDYVAPTTETEIILCELWQEVLQQERVGIHDNFFELGGHSLLAVRLVNRCQEYFYLKLPLAELFKSPTVASVAALIEQLRQQDSVESKIIGSDDLDRIDDLLDEFE